MANKDLVVKLTINSQDFENGLKNAKSSMKGMSANMAQAGISFKSLISLAGKFAGGLGLAISAGNLLAKNLKEIETVSDAVGRSQKMLNESIKTFFVSLNTGSLENFIGGLKEVVKAAKEAYDAIDNLGTYLNFSSADMAKNQAEQSKARYMIAAIKKGEEQGDLDYWQNELKRLAGEAENIIDKEVKHYEEAILASDRLLFAKFKGREKELSELKDKYTGTADKNEAAQNRYNILAEQRNEIIRLYGKNTNPNTARNSMYLDFMKRYGDELEFLEIVTKREKDLTEMNKLLIAQENKKNTLYNERRTNLKYLSQESGGGGAGGGVGGGKSSSLGLTLDQQMQYLTGALQNEILNNDRLKDAMVIEFEIPEEEIIEPETDAIVKAVKEAQERMLQLAKDTQTAFVAANALAGAFDSFGQISDGTLGKMSKGLGSVISQIAATIQAMMALTGAETVEGIADVFANTKGGVWTKLAMSAIALSGIMGIIASAKSSFAGSYANGGIIGGNSYTGDKLWIRANSGEMVLNQSQQTRLLNSMNGGGQVRFVIEGSQLKGVLDNYETIQNL